MADMNINEVQSSIDKVTSSMKNLVTLQMAQLTKSSAEYASHIDDAADKFKNLVGLFDLCLFNFYYRFWVITAFYCFALIYFSASVSISSMESKRFSFNAASIKLL